MRPQSLVLLVLLLFAAPISIFLPTPQTLLRTSSALAQTRQERRAEAIRLSNEGEKLRQAGQYEAALEKYQQALSIMKVVGYLLDEGALLNNIGLAYTGLGQNSQSLEILQQALKIFREKSVRQAFPQQSRAGESTTLNNIGLVYRNLGQYSRALDFYQQALLINREVGNRTLEGTTLNNIGAVYRNLGQYSRALDFYQQALSISRGAGSRNIEGTTLNNIGAVYEIVEKYSQALDFYQQALSIHKEVGNYGGEAATLDNIGLVYQGLRQYSQALESHQQALLIRRQIGDRSGEGTTLNNIGIVYQRLRRYSQALDLFQQALVINKQVGDHEGESSTLSNIGYFLKAQKQLELATVFYKQSINVTEIIREDIRKLPRESQETYTQSVTDTYRALADLLIQQGRLPEAQAVLELLKLRELRDFTRDAGIDSSGINLAKVEDAALKQILQRYTTIGAFSQKIDACEQTHCPELKQLQDQRDQLNQAVTTELTQQRAILTKYFATESATLTPDKLTPEARDIVNAQPGTILIYPLILKTKIQFLIALKAGDGAVILRPVETPNVSADTLFKTIQTFREQLQAPTNLAALKATSQQLYTWLIKPLEPELNNPAIKHLVFAPDSTTRYIPLAALFDGKRYLIERFSISTITAASETDTSETFAQLPVNDRFLLATGASTFANANPLENVPAELNAIVKPPNSRDQQGIYPGAALLNTQFDFEALKANLKGHRVLHIATHGSFQPGRVEDSYLLSGRSEKLTTTLINQLGQYGLKGIHLVVLSACETAVGDRASDGIEIPGISYFFLRNKVKAVMASLWSVNDASTSLMMQQFYKQLATGKTTKAEALQRVQQQFIAGKLTAKDAPSRSPTLIPKGNPQMRQSANGDFSHPFYWAPFILIGNSL